MAWSKALKVNPKAPDIIADDLEKKFDKLGVKIVNNAKKIVPIGVSRSATKNTKAHRAGALQRSITHDVTRKGNNVSLIVGVDAGTGEDVTYGGYVEDGTSKMPAQPFLRPAVYQTRGASL